MADSPLSLCFSNRHAAEGKTCDGQIFSGEAFSVLGDANFTAKPVYLNGTWGAGKDAADELYKGKKKSEWVEDFCWDARTHFATEGYFEFFTLRYETPVYLQSIEIGENRGMGSIVSIEAYEHKTGTFNVVWSGEPDAKLSAYYTKTGQYRVNLPYPVCQPAFASDVYRFKVDTVTVDDWNEFDYAKLQGSENLGPGILPSGATSVIYEAPRGFNAVDSFAYSATDCGYYADRVSHDQVVNVAPIGHSLSPFPVAVKILEVLVTSENSTVLLKEDLKFDSHTLVVKEEDQTS